MIQTFKKNLFQICPAIFWEKIIPVIRVYTIHKWVSKCKRVLLWSAGSSVKSLTSALPPRQPTYEKTEAVRSNGVGTSEKTKWGLGRAVLKICRPKVLLPVNFFQGVFAIDFKLQVPQTDYCQVRSLLFVFGLKMWLLMDSFENAPS